MNSEPCSKVIRTTGTEEAFEGRLNIAAIESAINAHCLDTVNLRDGRVMLVDDDGVEKDLPINLTATALYHSVCRPGTTHQIRGDVAVVHDADFRA
jgi:hypothetical protein